MSGISYKSAKAFEREIQQERQAQHDLVQAVKAEVERQIRPFAEFRARGFFHKLLWLFTGR